MDRSLALGCLRRSSPRLRYRTWGRARQHQAADPQVPTAYACPRKPHPSSAGESTPHFMYYDGESTTASNLGTQRMSTNLVQLEEQKTALLAGLDGWSTERLRFHPTERDWSSLQVVDHLIKTERQIQGRAREGLAAPHRLGLRDRLGNAFLTHVFRSSRKVKVPKSASSVLPAAEPQFSDLLSEWEQARRELSSLLAMLTPEQPSSGVFRHPVAGWMTMDGVLSFFSVHMHHHSYQLNTLRTLSEGL